MNKEELVNVVALTEASFNTTPKTPDQNVAQAKAWWRYLQHLPADEVEQIVTGYGLTSKFAPKPGEVWTLVARNRGLLPPTPDEAYRQALKVIRTAEAGLAYDPVHPLISKHLVDATHNLQFERAYTESRDLYITNLFHTNPGLQRSPAGPATAGTGQPTVS